MRNRHRITDEYYKPESLRAIFEQNELEMGIWLELIPHRLKMVIVQPGSGFNPRNGDFVRVKQFIYLENMVNVKQERTTYTFGRKKLIPGLEYCLGLCKEGFKGRFYIDSSLAYGKSSLPGIPANSNLVIDIQVNAITTEPISTGDYDDQQLITQIIAKAKDADICARSGNYADAQRILESSFNRIQSTRCKEIKNYLYNQSKISYMINNGEKTQAEVNKEIAEVVEMYKIFDMIKIKAVEMALINRDYYKVIALTKQCMMESRLEQNQRVIAARARAFAEVGEFTAALQIMQHLHDCFPNDTNYESELLRIQSKQKEYKSHQAPDLTSEPVLALTKPNSKPKRSKQMKKKLRYEEQEEYEADEQSMMWSEPLEVGMPLGYRDLYYFD